MAVDNIEYLNASDLEDKKPINNVKKQYSKLVDVLLIAFSICMLMVDMGTDLVLVVEYSSKGFYVWAGLTLLLVAVPTLIVEAFSIRWHSLDKQAYRVTWIAHALCLGVAHRFLLTMVPALLWYILALQTAAGGTTESLLHQQQDLCLLHLFNSFLEAAPQLVLQLYITITLGNIPPWTGLSLLASLLSLAWAIAGYTRAMRLCRPDKKPASWAALALQAVWRAGTLTARIVALTVLALTSPTWLAIFLVLHWLAMAAWAVWQRTDFCETWWEERAYNAVVGVIYCFCFFNLQEGPSRYRATAFYVIAVIENGFCVAIYAVWGGQWEQAHASNVKLVTLAVTLSTLLGLASMLFYFAFFHPAGVILPCVPAMEDCEARQNLSGSSIGAGSQLGRNTLRSLRHDQTSPDSRAVTPQRPPSSIANSTSISNDSPNSSKQVASASPSPITASARESPSSTSEAQLKRRPVCDINLSDLEDELAAESSEPDPPLPSQLKRRPFCRTDLLQGCDTPGEESPCSEEQMKRRPVYNMNLTEIEKPESKDQEWEGDDTATVTASEDKCLGDETDVTSTCMSTHDYENICAVNITREPWGLRHWDGYSSDIAEHDSSVAGGVDGTRDRRRDTLVSTSTSYYSSSSSSSGDKLAATQPRCSDYLDSLAEELKIAESEDNYTYVVQPYAIDNACYALDTIMEEEGSYETSSDDATIIPDQKPSQITNSCSSLVATIEEIRLSASLCNLYSPEEEILDSTLEWEESETVDQEWNLDDEVPKDDLNNTNELNWQNLSNKPLSQTEIDFLAQLKTNDVKETPPKKIRRKFSLLRERFEMGCAQKGDDENLEKPDCEKGEVTSRIHQWNNLLRGKGGTKNSPSTLSPPGGQNVVTLFPIAS